MTVVPQAYRKVTSSRIADLLNVHPFLAAAGPTRLKYRLEAHDPTSFFFGSFAFSPPRQCCVLIIHNVGFRRPTTFTPPRAWYVGLGFIVWTKMC